MAESELRLLLSRVVGEVPEPAGRSFHIHQLDGERLEAMVYLDATGGRVEWVHGKGDCAITGEGDAILALLRGEADATALESSGRLVLYGDRQLIGIAASIFGGKRSSL
jgi:hypothetical protein